MTEELLKSTKITLTQHKKIKKMASDADMLFQDLFLKIVEFGIEKYKENLE